MDAPPTRYKIVERGRRLEVIDTWNGNAPVRTIRDPEIAVPHSSPAPRSSDANAAVESMRAARLDQQGRAVLNTAAWYDAKGPRTITLNAQGETNLQALRVFAFVLLFIGALLVYLFWPFSLALPFTLMNGETRKKLQNGVAKFLDGLDQAAT